MAALRAALHAVLDRKEEFGEVLILNGARTVADMVYQDEMPGWSEIDELNVRDETEPRD